MKESLHAVAPRTALRGIVDTAGVPLAPGVERSTHPRAPGSTLETEGGNPAGSSRIPSRLTTKHLVGARRLTTSPLRQVVKSCRHRRGG